MNAKKRRRHLASRFGRGLAARNIPTIDEEMIRQVASVYEGVHNVTSHDFLSYEVVRGWREHRYEVEAAKRRRPSIEDLGNSLGITHP